MRLKLVVTLKLTSTPIVDDYKTTTKWLLRALGFTHAIARGGKRYEVFPNSCYNTSGAAT